MMIEQKYLALMGEAQRQGQADTAGLRLCFELLSLTTAIDRDCALRLAPHGLSEGKLVVLLLLCDQPEGLAPHVLAERAGVTRATITGLLDGLERDRLLDRHADAGDRRRLSVRLTEQGQEKARMLALEHGRWIASLFAGFTAEERDSLSRLLGRVWRNVKAGAA